MNASASDDAFPRQASPWIAACVSLMLHLVLMIVGVLVVRPIAQLASEDSSRPAGIVITSTSAASNKVAYFDEATHSDLAATATSQSTASAATTAALPASQPALSANIELPGAIAPVVEGVQPGTVDLSGAKSGKVVLDSSALTAEVLAEDAKRPRSRGPAGEQGEVSIFGSGTTRGHSFVFLIDRSQSMGSTGLGAIAAAETELVAALEKLEENHQFQVVAYNQSPTYFRDRKLIPVNDDSRRACREFLQNLAAFGATDHERALVSALHQLKPEVVYLLTDGDPALSPGQRKRILDQAGRRTRICCIQFGRIQPEDDSTRASLEALARDSGGTYVFVDMNKR